MSDSELHRKGMAMRTQLLGEEFTNNLNKTTYNDATMEVFRDIAVENVFGALWTRPGLDLKTRTLICVVSDTAMGRETELVLHLRMALRQGWTETELTETMVHLSGYIGVPLVRGAMLVASEVFAAVRQEAN
ncbi:MAG: 4-carboxymuconolactone decarboxylase [Gammaproteobacteria bacterium]|jgi:4-carboxymuconolactone decarboxylase